MNTNQIKITNYLLTSVAIVAHNVLRQWEGWDVAVFSFVFILSPLAINALIAFFAKTRASQVVLLCTSIVYIAWAFGMLMEIHSSSDGQAGLLLLGIAIIASPVLIIAWIACLVIEIIQRKKRHGHEVLQTTQA